MSGNAGAQGAQAAPSAGSQADPAAGGQEPPAPNGQEPGAAQPPAESPDERAARLERELQEARREAAQHRTRARELERAQAQAAQAGMSELERAQAERAQALERAQQLEHQLRDQALRSEALAAATRLNYRNPEVAYRLLDREGLDFTDDGQPKGVERQLRELLQREPYLGKGAGADYGGGNRGTQPAGEPTMNELIRAAVRGQ